jgi:hypothetical protein
MLMRLSLSVMIGRDGEPRHARKRGTGDPLLKRAAKQTLDTTKRKGRDVRNTPCWSKPWRSPGPSGKRTQESWLQLVFQDRHVCSSDETEAGMRRGMSQRGFEVRSGKPRCYPPSVLRAFGPLLLFVRSPKARKGTDILGFSSYCGLGLGEARKQLYVVICRLKLTLTLEE